MPGYIESKVGLDERNPFIGTLTANVRALLSLFVFIPALSFKDKISTDAQDDNLFPISHFEGAGSVKETPSAKAIQLYPY